MQSSQVNPDYSVFLQCQWDYIMDNSPICVVEKCRQVGFTWSSAYKVCDRIFSSEVPQDHFWISKDEFTAKLFLQDVLEWLDRINMIANHKKTFKSDIINFKNIQTMRIQFDCGSTLYVLSSSVDAVVGKRGHFYIDEAAIHKDFEALYGIVYPCTTWGYTMTIFSTHRSKQTFFYKLCDRIRKGEIQGGKLFTVTLETVLEQGYINKINERIAQLGGETYADPVEFFQEKRQNSSSEAMFLQEYMCIPADAEAVQAITEDDLLRIMRPSVELTKPIRKSGRYYAGIDIGRNRDLTVLWICEDMSTSNQPMLVTRHVEVMSRERFSDQEKRLVELLQLWRPRACWIDGTNVGEGLAERLEERFHFCQKIKITATTRAPWISDLIAFTRRPNVCLWVPDSNEVWEDFLSVERYINKRGQEDFFIPSHKERGHGDRFMSMVLCLQAFKSINSLARYTLQKEGTLKPETESKQTLDNNRNKSRRNRLSF